MSSTSKWSDIESSLRRACIRDKLSAFLGTEIRITSRGYLVVEAGFHISFYKAVDILASPHNLAEVKLKIADMGVC